MARAPVIPRLLSPPIKRLLQCPARSLHSGGWSCCSIDVGHEGPHTPHSKYGPPWESTPLDVELCREVLRAQDHIDRLIEQNRTLRAALKLAVSVLSTNDLGTVLDDITNDLFPS